MLDVGNHHSIDALLPPEMAERAEQIGVHKTRLDTPILIALAVLAGAFIAFGSMFSVVVMAGAEGNLPYGVKRLLRHGLFAWSYPRHRRRSGAFYRQLSHVMACASERIRVSELLRAWALVYAGNFVGAIAICVSRLPVRGI